MRRFAIVLAAGCVTLVGTSRPAAAQTGFTYSETVTLAPNGSAHVEAIVDVGERAANEVSIRAIGDPTHITTDTPSVPLRVDRLGGHPCLVLGSGARGVARIAIGYDVARFVRMDDSPLAHDNRRVSYSFENLADLPVDEFTGRVVLPPGTVVSAVDEVRPAVTDATVDLPYGLVTTAGARALTLSRRAVAFGDDVQVSFRMRSEGGRTGLFIGVGILALLYLVTFRDLIRAPQPRAKEVV